MKSIANPKASVLVLMIAAAVTSPSSSAWATSEGLPTPKTPGLPWTDSDQYRACGVGCLYEKGNENISLEAIYILKKIEFLKTASKDEILNNLGDFCMSPEPAEKNGKEQHVACFERYRDMQILTLQKMRAAIVKNSDSAAKLRSGAKGAKALEVVMNEEQPPGLEKAQVPYVPTFEDLQEEYKRMKKLSSNEYQDWVRSFPREPAKDDFVKYRDIPRDADNPAGEKMTIVDTNPDGTVKYDNDAFQLAKATYESKKAQMEDELKAMLKQKLPLPAVTMDASTVDPQSQDLYNQARGAVVQTTNEAIAASSGVKPPAAPSEVSFPGSQPRGPAGSLQGKIQGKDSLAKFTGKEAVMPAPKGPDGRDVYVTVTPDDLTGAIKDAALP